MVLSQVQKIKHNVYQKIDYNAREVEIIIGHLSYELEKNMSEDKKPVTVEDILLDV